MSLLLLIAAKKKARLARKAAFFAGAAVGIAKFATLAALPVAVALGAGVAAGAACKRRNGETTPAA